MTTVLVTGGAGYIGSHTGAHAWNLGTGQGYSVLEMVRAFEAASGRAGRGGVNPIHAHYGH
jgi:UDP-glucose 4-epimerase